MRKVYLMNGLAVMALALAATSCNKDLGGSYQVSPEEAIANAEVALGVEIDPNQTWRMTQSVEANVLVNGDYGANYEVSIYSDNPFVDFSAEVLGKAKVISGNTAKINFTTPKGTAAVFAAIKDEKGYSYAKPVTIINGKLETAFGGDNAASAPRRSAITRGSAADDFVIAEREQPDFSALINDATPITAGNNTTDPSNTVRHYLIPAGTTWSDNIPLIQASDPNDNSIVSVYVLGTLNVNEEQRINGGYGGAYKLIVGNGGVVNIASGVTLRSQANENSGYVGEIHVLAGGTIQGEGTLEFSNGTNSFNYNGGSIDVGTINNNGGTLYNAGTLEANYMQGGSGLSIYENAGKVHIGNAAKGSSTANTRIYNNCWWECDNTLSCRNIRQGTGAYIKAGNLEVSGSEDGTADASYIWAKGNSLIEVTGAVALNNVDIVGPTDNNYAYLQFGYAETAYGAHGLTTAMNYSTDWSTGSERVSAGAIINNIRLSVDHPDTNYNKYNNRGNPYQLLLDMLNGEMACTHNYDVATNKEWADTKLWPTQGNGNAVSVAKGQVNDIVSEDECSPGITIVPPTPINETKPIYSYAFEDTWVGDYDLNDVVLKVQEDPADENYLLIKLVASGATLDLNIRLYPADTRVGNEVAHYPEGQTGFTVLADEQGNTEVHDMLGVERGTMVNTGAGASANPVTIRIAKGSYDLSCLPIAIYSEAQGEVRLSGSGESPFGVIIPIDWKWPKERVRITSAYNKEDAGENLGDQSFKAFASEYGKADMWFAYPTGNIMR